jgi:hypothetical protein
MATMAAAENTFIFCFHILKELYIIDQRLKFHMGVTVRDGAEFKNKLMGGMVYF